MKAESNSCVSVKLISVFSHLDLQRDVFVLAKPQSDPPFCCSSTQPPAGAAVQAGEGVEAGEAGDGSRQGRCPGFHHFLLFQ